MLDKNNNTPEQNTDDQSADNYSRYGDVVQDKRVQSERTHELQRLSNLHDNPIVKVLAYIAQILDEKLQQLINCFGHK